jgi:DNA-binding response OmpR family regulator
VPGWRLSGQARLLLRPDGSAVPLSGTEFAFFRALAARAGAPVPRAELARAVFQRRREADLRALDSLAYALRRRLEAEGLAGCILTLRNRGYAFAGFPPG